MSGEGTTLATGAVVFAALVLFGESRAAALAEGVRSRLALPVGDSRSEPNRRITSSFGLRLHRWRVPLAAAGLGLAGAGLGSYAIPVVGPFIGAVAGISVPLIRARRERDRRAAAIERELEDLVAATALAMRSGQSVGQAVRFAATEVREPLRALLDGSLAEQRLGSSLEEALALFADRVGTEDARMFVMVIGIQARSGGNLAAALEEVAETIRYRISVRREIRALSAQGRLSGAILGLLPIGFFLVLGVTSREELGPVYRSGAGVALVVSGLAMQAVAYLWIRHLLNVEA